MYEFYGGEILDPKKLGKKNNWSKISGRGGGGGRELSKKQERLAFHRGGIPSD